jgi:hypothetical protein
MKGGVANGKGEDDRLLQEGEGKKSTGVVNGFQRPPIKRVPYFSREVSFLLSFERVYLIFQV